MYFGGTPFAASPFGDPGFNPNAFVNVTGSRINEFSLMMGAVIPPHTTSLRPS